MLRLSVRKTREGGYRVGYGAQHVYLRAKDRKEAHAKGKALWRQEYGTITQRNVKV